MPSANRNPYQSWHGTPRADHQRRSGADLNSHTTSLPRRNNTLDRRRMGNDRDAAIPLIEYSLVENGGHPGGGGIDDMGGRGGHYITVPDRGHLGSGTLPRLKVNMSDNNRLNYDHANHIGSGNGLMGNHVDSAEAVEADESLDYYPDGGPPRTRTNNHRGYVKYNSFANY